MTELGTKRQCPQCSAKFYDLTRNPAICPKCGCTFDPSALSLKPKRSRKKADEDGEDLLARKRRQNRDMDDDTTPDGEAFDDVSGVEPIEDIDELEDYDALGDVKEHEDAINDDDAEAIIEDLDTGDTALVDRIEDEEDLDDDGADDDVRK